MKYVFVCLLLVFLLFGNKAAAQASQNFELQPTTLNATSVTVQYVDPSSTPIVTHELMADMAGGRNIPVSSPSSGTTLGFTSVINAPGADGLAEDIFGYATVNVATSSGVNATGAGAQLFAIEDTEGLVVLTFDKVLIPAGGSTFTMNFGLDNSYESGDRVAIGFEATNCGAAATVNLIEITGGGGSLAPTYTGPATGGAMDGSWNTINQNLIAYAGCQVQLVIEAQMNSSGEEFFFDNINFTAGAILPVEFMAFTANQRKGKVVLDWATATENENRGFSVERSFDGSEFTTIGWVSGNGIAEAQTDYDFEDEDVVVGQDYYYRLRQEDFDGAFAYSAIATVHIAGDNQNATSVSAFPNPTTDGQSNLELFSPTADDWTVYVLDANGRIVSETKYDLPAGLSLLPLNLTDQPVGTYFVRVAGTNKTIYQRIVR